MPELLEPLVVPLGMRAQLVSRAAADRLPAATGRIDRPVDTFLQLRETSGVRVFTAWPTGVSEISSELGGSTIHSRRKRELWLKREWDRFAQLARAAITPTSKQTAASMVLLSVQPGNRPVRWPWIILLRH